MFLIKMKLPTQYAPQLRQRAPKAATFRITLITLISELYSVLLYD